MTKKRNSISDIQGAGRLAADAVNGVVDIVEAMHYNVTSLGGLLKSRKTPRTSGITGLVYRNIRSITGMAGKGFDAMLANLSVIVSEKEPSPEHEALLAALNGVIGDHLQATNNPLVISMQLRRHGKAIDFGDWLNKAGGLPKKKIALLIHGSCMNDLQWLRQGHDHGAALAADLEYFPVYLHYNSGLHVSENGKKLSELLDSFFSTITDEVEIVVIAHSMGGLVIRSACHYGSQAGHGWLKHVKKSIFLGTPHHGAPLEQTGNWIDTMLASNVFSAPISNLGKLRSAGITDLRYGNVLDDDWNGRDRFQPVGDLRTPVPLPEEVECYAIAAVINERSSILGDDIIGDGLVPLYSATGKHEQSEFCLQFPDENVKAFRKMKHLDLLSHPLVYGAIKGWLKD